MALSFVSGPSPEEAAQAGVLSPEALERRRMLAMALMKQGSDSSPIQSPWQGVARVTDAISGQLQNYWADQDEKSARNASSQRTSSLLGGLLGGGGAAGPQASVTAPSSGAAGAAPSSGSTSQAINTTLSPNQKALLDTIAGTESPGYNVMYGGKRFDNYADHPRVAVPIASGPNAGKTSSAAGRYQFLGSTWDAQAKKLGLKDFSPENQDLAAWDLAATTYAAKTGRDLIADLNDPNARGGIGRALSGVWTSLPGGIEAGTNQSRFAQAYANNLGHYGNAAVAAASPQQPAPAPVQVASADPSFAPQMPAAGAQASPFTPASDLKQGNFQPGSLTPAQAKQYADNGYNVPNEAINWGQDGASATPSAGTPQIETPQSGAAAVTNAIASGPKVAQASPNLSSGGQAVANAMAPPAAAPMQGSLTPQQLQQFSAVLNDPYASAADKQIVAGIIQQRMKPQEYGFQTLPDGTILRTDPRTGTVAPIYQATPKPMQVGDRLVMPDGRVVADFSAPPTATVGNSVVNTKTGQVVFQAPPNQEYRELNGRAIAFDPRSGGARDVTPDGIPSGYRPATDQERAQYGVAPGIPLYFGPDGKPASLGPQTSVSIQGGESQFDKTVGEGQGKMFLGLAEDGPQAKADLGNIKQLRSAIATLPGGFLGGAQAIANQYGIKLGENAGNLEYANAILSKLTPAQRQGMPGSASDRDVQMFRDALPKLSNTPEGNKLILDTMEALANQRLEQARIATLVTTNQMNRQDGMKALQDLPDPFAGLKAALGPQEAPKQGGVVPAAPQATQAAPGAPQPGTVEGGYRFKGGDPSKPENWERVQ